MVTTRAKSKLTEPPAVTAAPVLKRKLTDGTAPASSAAQPPAQPSPKRQRKSKASTKSNASTTPTAPAQTKRKSNKGGIPGHQARTQGKDQERTANASATFSIECSGSVQPDYIDLTQDNDFNEDEPKLPPRPAASQDVDNDDGDSRYALSSRRKGKAKKPVASAARQMAELMFEEGGVEEIDKAEAAVASASNRASFQANKRGPTPRTTVNSAGAGSSEHSNAPQGISKRQHKANQKKIGSSTSRPSKAVMFTVVEAIQALLLYKGGTMSVPAEIDADTRQPYESVQTGEYLSYPVKGTYHLGALGRYGVQSVPAIPFALTVPLSKDAFIERNQQVSAASPPRHGLGFDGAIPIRPKAVSVRRPNNYCFTFGKYKGRRMDSVPIEYLRSIRDGDNYHNDERLRQAFADLYPKGLYESEVESYTFEKGGFKGKRLDEVPKTYLWSLLRKAKEDKLPKKGKGRLERALELWEKQQLDLTKD